MLMSLLRFLSVLLVLQGVPVNASSIEVDRYGYKINGEYTFLRGGTLQWFRVPEGEWDDRLEKFKRAGFNTVDLYVPWNIIEPKPNEFNFDTPNLSRFLDIAHEKGLYVYFRPGPYITNEMDSGGLPNWLLQNTTKSGRAADGKVLLRDNDPDYMFYVERYFKNLNEHIKPYLISNGGPIILYALENEYNYFESSVTTDKSFIKDGVAERPLNYTPDTKGYFTAMRDIVRSQGIDVPLATCPGSRIQGTGNTPGVIPMPNLYQSDRIDYYMYEDITSMHSEDRYDGVYVDFPSGITEADRTSSRLKRIFMSGMDAAFLFNISGGIQPGYNNAIGVWGFDFNKLLRNPSTNDFTSIGYFPNTIDFYGPISANGGLRPKFYNIRRANLFFDSFEKDLAPLLHPERSGKLEAGVIPNPWLSIDNPFIGAQEEVGRVHYWHKTDDNKHFVQVLNETGRKQIIHTDDMKMGTQSLPRYTRLEVFPEDDPSHYWLDTKDDLINSVILLANYPIAKGIQLEYTTSETLHLGDFTDDRLLILYGKEGAQGETKLKIDGDFAIESTELRLRHETETEKTLVYRYKSRPQLATVTQGERKTRILILTKALAGRTWFETVADERLMLIGPDYVESNGGEGLKIHWNEDSNRIMYTLSQGVRFNELSPIAHEEESSIKSYLQVFQAPEPEAFQSLDLKVNLGLSLDDTEESRQHLSDGRQWIQYDGRPRPLEDFQIPKGHGWYQTTFSLDSLDGIDSASLYVEHASDFVGIYINGQYLTTLAPQGTEIYSQHGSGNYSFSDLAPYLKLGENLISFRTEVWGHGSFMFPRGKFRLSSSQAPSVSFDSKKGLYGYASVGIFRKGEKQEIELDSWAVSQHTQGELDAYQEPSYDRQDWAIQSIPSKLGRGQVLWYQTSFSGRDLPMSSKQFAPVSLRLKGQYAKATIYLNGTLVGRWLSGREWIRRGTWLLPTRDLWARINPDQIPLPTGYLNKDENTLAIIFEDTSDLRGDQGYIEDLSIIYNQEKWGEPYVPYSEENILRSSIQDIKAIF